MAVGEVSQYLNRHESGLDRFNLNAIPQDQADAVENYCLNSARLERLKSAGLMILSGTAALGDKVLMPLAVALIAFQVAELVVGIVFIPLAIIYPVYELVTDLTAIGLGLGMFGAYMGYRNGTDVKLKEYSDEFFKSSRTHWDHSDHWYAQAKAVRTHFAKA